MNQPIDPRDTSSQYGRRIPDPDQKRDDACEAPKASGFSLWRRWRDGLMIFVFVSSSIECVTWILNAMNLREGSSGILQGVVSIVAMVVVFVVIPILTFECAYLFVVRPWYRKHMIELRNPETPKTFYEIMTEQSIPESRTYQHIQCGNETVVGGQAFETVSNPMSSMEQTLCSTCAAMFPISDFEWVDTNEKLSDYYARHTKTATDMQRFLCSKKFMIIVIAVFSLLTTVGVYILVANDGLLTRAICVLGGLMIGAIIGMTVFLKVIANPITRKVCGVSDTRLLT